MLAGTLRLITGADMAKDTSHIPLIMDIEQKQLDTQNSVTIRSFCSSDAPHVLHVYFTGLVNGGRPILVISAVAHTDCPIKLTLPVTLLSLVLSYIGLRCILHIFFHFLAEGLFY